MALGPTVYRLTLDAWSDAIELPRAPVTAVVEVGSGGGTLDPVTLGRRVALTGTVVAENTLGGKVTSTYTCDYYDDTAHVRITSR